MAARSGVRRLGVGCPSPLSSGTVDVVWSLSAPILLGTTGADVLGSARLTDSAAELTALLAALTWRATRIVSDSKVSIDLVGRRAQASPNTALVQQCRHALTVCRAVAPTVLAHTYSHQGLSGNEIADTLAKAAANGIARPEGVAHRCRELLSWWCGDHFPRELAQVLHPAAEQPDSLIGCNFS